MLPDNKTKWDVMPESDVETAPPNIEAVLDTWKLELQWSSLLSEETDLDSQTSTSISDPRVCPIADLSDSMSGENKERDTISAIEVDRLNDVPFLILHNLP